MTDLGPVGQAYAAARSRIDALVRGEADPKAVSVGRCPEWSAHDLVAHVSGVVDDALNGRLDGVATDPWTAAQVARGRDRTTAELLDQWAEQAPAFEGILDGIGPAGRQAVFDLVTHEHDLRDALRAQGARDSDGVATSVGFMAEAVRQNAAAQGVPVPGFRTTDGQSWTGDDDAAVVTADAFELIRAATGRRSERQIRSLTWDGDVDAVLPAFSFGPFAPSETDIVE